MANGPRITKLKGTVMNGSDLASNFSKREKMIVDFMSALLSNGNLQIGIDPSSVVQLAIQSADAILSALPE